MLLSRMADGTPEIFASIQGEGASIGVPSVFVRFAECNLRCEWCDTKYTWDWEAHDKARETIEVSLDDVVARVRSLGARNVVITGGEPLLHQPDLAALIAGLDGHRIEIETNGTIEPVISGVDQWNVSPKLENSGNKRTARLRTVPMSAFAKAGNAFFKFVVATPADVDEILGIARTYEIAAERILLMPEGTTPEELAAKSAWLVDVCRAHGFRFTTRLHVLIWGSKRGT